MRNNEAIEDDMESDKTIWGDDWGRNVRFKKGENLFISNEQKIYKTDFKRSKFPFQSYFFYEFDALTH